MNCAGISPPLFQSSSDGAGSHKSYRRLVNTTIEHLSRLVSEEASRKLELPVALSFERLRGTDIQGIARALKALVASGATYADALVHVGLA